MSISHSGEVIIGFTSPVLIPVNYSDFNSSVLDIWINSKKETPKIKDWNCTSFSANFFKIQLYFYNALEISAY